MSAAVLILTGSPGAGKTTVARAVADRFHSAVHLEADPFFRFVVSGHVEPWKPESHAQNEIVMRAVAAAAGCYAAGGYFTIIDGIVLPRWFLEPLRESFARARLPTAYAVLRAPLETCISRAAARRGAGELADPEVIEDLWRQFAELGTLEPHAIETGDTAPEETAREIAARLEDGSLILSG